MSLLREKPCFSSGQHKQKALLNQSHVPSPTLRTRTGGLDSIRRSRPLPVRYMFSTKSNGNVEKHLEN